MPSTARPLRASFLFAGLISLLFATVVHAEKIPVWIYHNFPPFVLDVVEKRGLSFDLADRLSEISDGQYQFEVEVIPRQRLNLRLAAGKRGVVFWANNNWFNDPDKDKYLWARTLMHDQSVVISPQTAPFEYDGPASMMGMKFVGVGGHSYAGVDQLIAQNEIERLDLRGEESVALFIASGRGSVAILPQSATQYFIRQMSLGNTVYVAPQIHTSFERYVMVHPDLVDVFEMIDEALQNLQASREWHSILQAYDLEFTD